jgi:hypothetical protein
MCQVFLRAKYHVLKFFIAFKDPALQFVQTFRMFLKKY